MKDVASGTGGGAKTQAKAKAPEPKKEEKPVKKVEEVKKPAKKEEKKPAKKVEEVKKPVKKVEEVKKEEKAAPKKEATLKPKEPTNSKDLVYGISKDLLELPCTIDKVLRVTNDLRQNPQKYIEFIKEEYIKKTQNGVH